MTDSPEIPAGRGRRIVHAEVPIVSSPSGLPTRHLVTAGDGARALFIGEQWLQPGDRVLLHTHPVEETLTFRSGLGEATIDGVSVAIGPGITLHIPAGIVHGFRCDEGEMHVFIAFPTPHFAETTIIET